MDKRKQFENFYEILKSGKSVQYDFYIDLDWFGNHGSYEKVNGDWIEGVTERLIDGDDGNEVISFVWKLIKTKNLVTCTKKLKDYPDEIERRFQITEVYWDDFENFFLSD
jgi:hypothetical protein